MLFDYVVWLGNHLRISFVFFTWGICESEKIILSGQRGVVTQVEGEVLLNMLLSLNPPQESGGEMGRGEIGLRKTEWKSATMCERPPVHERKNPISGKRHFNRSLFVCFKARMEKEGRERGMQMEVGWGSSVVSVHCSDNSCLECSGQHGGLPFLLPPP